MIAVVYHVYCVGKWREIVREQLDRLKKSGLYDAADILWMTANEGNIPCIVPSKPDIDSIIADYPKIHLEYYETNTYEFMPIKKVWELGQQYDDIKILYFHAKGVSNTYKRIDQPEIFAPKVRGIQDWRIMLEYFCIDKWEESVRKLNDYDNVGVNCVHGWYWGNFWWTQSKHLRNKKCLLGGSRWDAESWLNSGWWVVNEGYNATNYEHHHFTFCPYYSTYPKYFYDGTLKDNTDTIELISAIYGPLEVQIDEGRLAPNNVGEFQIDVTEDVRKNLAENEYRGFSFTEKRINFDKVINYTKLDKFLLIKYRFRDEDLQLCVYDHLPLKFKV